MTDEQISSEIVKDLVESRRAIKRRMKDASDRDYATLAKLLIEVNEKLEAYGEAGQKRETGLSKFMQKLQEKHDEQRSA